MEQPKCPQCGEATRVLRPATNNQAESLVGRRCACMRTWKAEIDAGQRAVNVVIKPQSKD